MDFYYTASGADPLRPEGILTLDDIRAKIGEATQDPARRDALPAFRVIAERAHIDLASVPASASGVRRLFHDIGPTDLGVSGRRYANIRSLIAGAVGQFGMRRRQLTKDAPIGTEWIALLDSVGRASDRWALSRLARYGTAMQVEPEAVDAETLRGFVEAMDAEAMIKDPRRLLKHTIAIWNMCAKRIPDWPAVRLASPFKVEAETMRLEQFPESFQVDVERWISRAKNPDPLDETAPVRALRPATIKGTVVIFRRFASVLVRRGIVPMSEMTGLAVFFEGDHFKAGLRCLLKRAPDGTISTHYAFGAAGTLISVARHYVRLEEARLVQIEAVRRKIDPQKPRTMGRRNRDRLDQFDDERNVERLLNFPEAEATRALANRNPFRRAKGMERALAVSLLIVTALRIKNLRSIHLTRNIRRAGAHVFVLFGRTESKNGIDIEIELPADTVKLLDRFIAEHRPHLPGHEGAYLFPGQDGGPKSDNAMREGINAALKRHAGLTVSPHLFRHIVAKIAIERDPSLYGAVSRHLGHKSIGTTLGSYLGTETKAASRRLNEIIAEAKASADAKGTDKRITRGRL